MFHFLSFLQASTLNLEFYFRNDTNKYFINWNQPTFYTLHFWGNNSIFNATVSRIHVIYVMTSVCLSVCPLVYHWKLSFNDNLMLFEYRKIYFVLFFCLLVLNYVLIILLSQVSFLLFWFCSIYPKSLWLW